jgi:hypothetical protein
MPGRVPLLLLQLLLLLVLASSTTYYISPTGSDSNAGTSPDSPWLTCGPVNALTLSAGDAVLFDANASAPHTLPAGLIVSAPVTVGAYNGAVAHLLVDGSRSAAVLVQATGGVTVANLSVAHQAASSASSSASSSKPTFAGIELSAGDGGDAGPRFANLTVVNVYAAGFANGISVDATGCRGFSDVLIRNCTATGSLGTGIASTGAYGNTCWSHAGIVVEDCVAHDNQGDPDDTGGWSGSGIVLSGVDGAVIRRSLAYRNGFANGHQGGGPCGIWFWQANNGLITSCVSHSNGNGKPPGTSNDGCGFDLDGGTSNSVVEFSLAFNNSGPGFLLCSFGGPRPSVNLTVRNSVSYGDGERSANGAAAVNFYTPDTLTNMTVEGNTLVSLPGSAGPRTPLVAPTVAGNRGDGFALRRNALLALNGAPPLSMPAAQLPAHTDVEGNAYWAPGAASLVEWAGADYATLAAFRAATGQEPPAAGGTDADPGLTTDGNFFRDCVPWWDGASNGADGGFPALPNSPVLDSVRGFAGCGGGGP